MNMNILKIAAITVALLCFGISAAHKAVAAEPGDVLTRTVHYDDLNLGTEAGAKVLHQRIRAAAREVCEPFVGPRSLQSPQYQTCMTHAVDSSVAQVNVARLTAYHAAMTKSERAG
jgi:UrcA family protein